jgi:hypothetical protein
MIRVFKVSGMQIVSEDVDNVMREMVSGWKHLVAPVSMEVEINFNREPTEEEYNKTLAVIEEGIEEIYGWINIQVEEVSDEND